jgi:hypothetical protein
MASKQTTKSFPHVRRIAVKISLSVYIFAKMYSKTKEYNLVSSQQETNDKLNNNEACNDVFS